METNETLNMLRFAIEYTEYALNAFNRSRWNDTDTFNKLYETLKNLRIIKHDIELTMYPYLKE